MGKQFLFELSNAKPLVAISRTNGVGSLVISVGTGLISKAPEWGPDPGGSVRFKRSRGGEASGGRKGAAAPGAVVGWGRARGSCVRRGPVFAPSLTSNLNQELQRYVPRGYMRGLSRDSGPGPASDALASLLAPHRRERQAALISDSAGSGRPAAAAPWTARGSGYRHGTGIGRERTHRPWASTEGRKESGRPPRR